MNYPYAISGGKIFSDPDSGVGGVQVHKEKKWKDQVAARIAGNCIKIPVAVGEVTKTITVDKTQFRKLMKDSGCYVGPGNETKALLTAYSQFRDQEGWKRGDAKIISGTGKERGDNKLLRGLRAADIEIPKEWYKESEVITRKQIMQQLIPELITRDIHGIKESHAKAFVKSLIAEHEAGQEKLREICSAVPETMETIERVRRLLRAGILPSEEIFDLACQKSHVWILHMFLDEYKSMNLTPDQYQKYLHKALTKVCTFCNPNSAMIVSFLLDECNKIGLKDDQHQKCLTEGLCFAAKIGRDEAYQITQLLVENGADVNLPNNAGEMPLHRACKCGAPKIVKYLLKKGADPEAIEKVRERAAGASKAVPVERTPEQVLSEEKFKKKKQINFSSNDGSYGTCSHALEAAIEEKKKQPT